MEKSEFTEKEMEEMEKIKKKTESASISEKNSTIEVKNIKL